MQLQQPRRKTSRQNTCAHNQLEAINFITHNFARYWMIKIILSRQTKQQICNEVLVKDPTTPKSCCYTTLWCIVNHHTRFRVFWHQYFTGSVAMHWGVVGYFIITLLQIYCYVCRWKNFDNRSVFGKIRGKNSGNFFPDTVYIMLTATDLEPQKPNMWYYQMHQCQCDAV